MESHFFHTLANTLDKSRKCRVVIPLAQDEACAYAVEQGLKTGIVEATLIGNHAELQKVYPTALKNPSTNVMEAPSAETACKLAVSLIREGKADIMMKGMVPTSTLAKAILNSEEGIKKNPLLSHLTFFDCPKMPGLKVLTDVAINIAPDADTLAKIAENAIEAFSLFSREVPRVALLAANEKVTEKVPSTVLAKQTAEHFPQSGGPIVEGPISLDLSVSPESVKIKNYKGRIQGNAHILVVPRIEVGNSFYKSLQYFTKTRMAGVVYGAKCPVVLTSRGDNNDTKYYSLLLAVAMHSRQRSSGN